MDRCVDGRRTYVKANENSLIFPELHGLMEKTTGVIPLLTEEIARFKNKMRWAFVYGSVARGEESAASDVDVMLIGEVSTMEIVPAFCRIEKRRAPCADQFSESPDRALPRDSDDPRSSAWTHAPAP